MNKAFLIIIITIFLVNSLYSASIKSDSIYIIDNKVFVATSSNNDWTNNKLTILQNNKVIFEKLFDGSISNIEMVDFNNDNRNTFLISEYTGGAHCCYNVYFGKFMNDDLVFTDTLWLGNSDYEISDLHDNGTKEFVYYNDNLSYKFSSFATSRFYRVILERKEDGFIDATHNYKGIINEDIKELKRDLDGALYSDFDCDPLGTDTYYQKSGPVKSILAAIVASYHSINETQKGYELIDEVYNCSDKTLFINILKSEYNFY